MLAALPDGHREAFVVSGCSVGTVRSRVARARATLTALLTEGEASALATPAAA